MLTLFIHQLKELTDGHPKIVDDWVKRNKLDLNAVVTLPSTEGATKELNGHRYTIRNEETHVEPIELKMCPKCGNESEPVNDYDPEVWTDGKKHIVILCSGGPLHESEEAMKRGDSPKSIMPVLYMCQGCAIEWEEPYEEHLEERIRRSS